MTDLSGLMEGYQIAKRQIGADEQGAPVIRYYLQQQNNHSWVDVRGPFRQSFAAKEWLRRQKYGEWKRPLRERKAARRAQREGGGA